LTGSGQCIGIAELGGGYLDSDVTAYFNYEGLPVPTVISVGVDGAVNDYNDNTLNANVEVALDIQLAGSVAYGAKIVVYFGPNSDQGWIDLLNAMVADNTSCNGNHFSVISISWGGVENTWMNSTVESLESIFQHAAFYGITITTASGDQGSENGDFGSASVTYPCSSAYTLCCGGTAISVTNNEITEEIVWNNAGGASGGGISTIIPRPSWQNATYGDVVLPNRGVPDVSFYAGYPGYYVELGGTLTNDNVGTSAAAPMWAGFIALMNEKLSPTRLGLLNPIIYNLPNNEGFRDITSGNNQIQSGDPYFLAQPGWDACTGWGSPNGTVLMNAIVATKN